jgi:hypothetical protein
VTIDKPARTFDLTINGEATKVVMSFAMFQEIMKVIPSPENIAHLLIQDFYLREYVVRRLLTGKKTVNSDEDMVDLFELNLDDDAVDEMILWITDHILYFFTSTAEKSMVLGSKYQAKMTDLTQSARSQTGAES